MTRSPKSDLALRLITSAIWGPCIIYLLFGAPAWAFPAVAASVCALSAWELFGIVAAQHRLLRVWGALASVAFFSLIAMPELGRFLPMATVAVVCLGMMVALVQPLPLEQAGARLGWAVAGPLYMGGLYGTLASLFTHAHGGSWVLLALMCGFFSDTGGYFAGRAFGRHKLHPLVSPNKTVEGTLGGLGAGLLGGLLAHFWYLPELALLPAVALSLLAAAVGQAGDLCESLLKRSAGVKDSGTLLPGHGGLLDRSDAMLFSAATIWVYVALSGA